MMITFENISRSFRI